VLIVTPVPGTYQCAEIERIALGLGVCPPIRRQASVYPLLVTAFMGLPCPKKIAGIRSGTSVFLRQFNVLREPYITPIRFSMPMTLASLILHLSSCHAVHLSNLEP
jgi:hypothetical protein